MDERCLMSMDMADLAALMQGLGEPKFRAGQVFAWLARGMKPQGMTNLPQGLRDTLSALPFGGARVHDRFISAKDGTVKYLFELEDGNLVEGVLMRYRYGNTLCISTQVGCRMGCAFCASTLDGCVRNLTPGEMLSFIARAEEDEPLKEGAVRAVTNIVLMGSGEPLDNYDNVVKFLRMVSAPEGMNISPRNISLSTCGLVPKLLRFMREAPHVTLSISLHAATDEARSRIMPVNRRYPIAELLGAAKAYAQETGRRVIFEYALILGQNDSSADASALAKLVRGIPCHVNLIPLNAIKERGLKGATREGAARFAESLVALGVSATVRRELGTDIEGACGQLRRRVLQQKNDSSEETLP
ncbi:MAG: 23S rRNA (adenine(2503)-C(2))-methyltransferase RlmN [Christensenellaceae bacterium]|jgi:23S rRNA (adenine2503-C2)-methyltransferase|nr:23S rRNA (adenine(2503)-C(2))-methyltransferase RlmN [Christensenellaceae bacterium]